VAYPGLAFLGPEWIPILAATIAALVAAVTLAMNMTAGRRDPGETSTATPTGPR